MRTLLATPLLALLLLLPGCELMTGPDGQTLTVRREPPQLVATNRGNETIYYFAIEADLAPRALWGPCTDPVLCDGIPPGAETRLDYEDVSGYHPEATDALVYWWHLVPDGAGAFEPDSIRVVAVQF